MIFLLFLVLHSLDSAITLDDFNLTGISHDPDDPYTQKTEDGNVRFNFRKKVGYWQDEEICETDNCLFQQIVMDVDGQYCYCFGEVKPEDISFLANNSGLEFSYKYNGVYTSRTLSIKFQCSKQENIDVSVFSNSEAEIIWKHPQGCPNIKPDPDDPNNPDKPDPKKDPKKKKLSFGSVMLIILSVLAVLYFAIGIPVMYFALKKRGLEIIPFVNFWKSLPGLVIDGVKFCLSPCLKSKSGYGKIDEKSQI
ncbi:putative Autophagy-related protein 27 [Monocercomonoides exilis]|uniref:putative Autophagy-related protein 27 n=1 Tax=Monocercomonoides exilis TaxID=2049356 RepID=UPI003559AF62|nr:putative Autophagy-related protein 27 [Monocercomonoides exilis]